MRYRFASPSAACSSCLPHRVHRRHPSSPQLRVRRIFRLGLLGASSRVCLRSAFGHPPAPGHARDFFFSALFSWYAAHFGNFNETYGSLGAVIGFMTWLWISAIVILLGAELNAEMEHQTVRDTTTGAPKPLGMRGARMADTVGAPQRG